MPDFNDGETRRFLEQQFAEHDRKNKLEKMKNEGQSGGLFNKGVENGGTGESMAGLRSNAQPTRSVVFNQEPNDLEKVVENWHNPKNVNFSTAAYKGGVKHQLRQEDNGVVFRNQYNSFAAVVDGIIGRFGGNKAYNYMNVGERCNQSKIPSNGQIQTPLKLVVKKNYDDYLKVGEVYPGMREESYIPLKKSNNDELQEINRRLTEIQEQVADVNEDRNHKLLELDDIDNELIAISGALGLTGINGFLDGVVDAIDIEGERIDFDNNKIQYLKSLKKFTNGLILSSHIGSKLYEHKELIQRFGVLTKEREELSTKIIELNNKVTVLEKEQQQLFQERKELEY